jgi:DNA-directed RNA polymerase beta' subunit
MGHIELAAPVSHIWYFKGIPSRMGLILDMSPRQLEKVIYFASYIVLDPGETTLEYKQVLSEREYQDAKETYGNKFRVGMGAEAIKELLEGIDLEKEIGGEIVSDDEDSDSDDSDENKEDDDENKEGGDEEEFDFDNLGDIFGAEDAEE